MSHPAMRRPLVPVALALTLALPLALPHAAISAPVDQAARGLDVFLHAPTEVAPGATLPIAVEALGFPTVVTLAPLGGATIEAGWDPEHLGPDVAVAPPSVRAVTDSAGRAHLDVPVPAGEPRKLKLLVSVKSGAHERTRSIDVDRVRAFDVSLHVPDSHVVPGSETSAWALVTSASTGAPVADTKLTIELLEGGVARSSFDVVTDAAGTAVARVPIPRSDDPEWSWRLRARVGADGESVADLVSREETPGTPRFDADFDEAHVHAGDPARYSVRVRDAAGKPVASLPVRTWIGPRGTNPPKDGPAWEKASTLGRTDAAGRLVGTATAPTLVARGSGTRLQLVARATVEGRDLEAKGDVEVGAPTSGADLVPEAGSIVPGAEQRLLLRVYDGRGKPIAATFQVEGDGLAATVTTDAHGEGELVWTPPTDVGGRRDVGPCAGSVAASVRVRAKGAVPALGRAEPFDLCLPVDRAMPGFVRAATPIVRAGEPLAVRVVTSARGRTLDAGTATAAVSLVARSARGHASFGAFLDDKSAGATIPIPASASGLYTLSAAAPLVRAKPAAPPKGAPPTIGDEEDATTTVPASPLFGGAVVVVPRVLGKLAAKVVGGRAAPGGTVDVEVTLDDGHGKGLRGSVAGVLVDRYGGGSTGGIEGLDTRASLCRALGAAPERCDQALEGGAAEDPFRRAAIASDGQRPLAPLLDPGATASEGLRKAFGDVVRSLEGAVYEASASPERLRDVGRKGAGHAWTFNPELTTLVTAAMDPPPTTPGGEPLTLADLVAIDKQVTFDHVARRVTRLKLFRVLEAVRRARRDKALDADEPALRDPNALLRRLARTGEVTRELLVDPWGGAIRFGRASGPGAPFLGVARGFELRSPGPDGVLGNADDVRDPFERVLASGTPYARATGEDRIVDARTDMEVGDATVSSWQALLETLTGTSLGSVGHGAGTGSGQGFGSGHGRLGGSSVRMGATRVSHGISTGVAWWAPPARTDDHGRVVLRVPLGEIETTWQLALVGVPDGAGPATTTLDVPVSLPLSARLDAGARWTEGDEVDVAITVRNGGDAPLRATVEAETGGVAKLVGVASRVVDVPAKGSVDTTVRVAAPKPGTASLRVHTTAPGAPEDRAALDWEVGAAGELVDKAAVRWVAGREELSLAASAKPLVATGTPRLRLERGADGALAAALDALDPDRLATAHAMADAIEVGTRLERWAIARSGEKSPVAVRAADVARRAEARLEALATPRDPGFASPAPWAATARALLVRPPHEDARRKRTRPGDGCPPKSPTLAAGLEGVEAEPPPNGGSVDACWDAYVTDTIGAATSGSDPMALARLVLALADRPHRAAVLAVLADRLREKVALDASGRVTLPGPLARDRAARATIYAALLRAAAIGTPPAKPSVDVLAAWALVERDPQGGYGSPLATRSVVRALLSWVPEDASPTKVVVESGGARREIDLLPGASADVPLPAGATAAVLEARGAPFVARFEQPMLRPFWHAPDDMAAPARIDVSWPEAPVAGASGTLRVSLRHTLGRATTLDARIPLPPGVTLAAPVHAVRQIQGVLVLRTTADASPLPQTLEIPVRFGLAGKVTAREAKVGLTYEDAPRALAPARTITIAERPTK
jgi:hypothetical protein